MKAVESHLREPRYGEKPPAPARRRLFLLPHCRLFTQTFIIALFNYRIFSSKEKNTWWAWQVAHHHHSTGRWLVLGVCKLSNSGQLLFPFILINLGKSNSLTAHTKLAHGASKEASSCLWPMEKCLSLSYQLPVHRGGISTYNHISET